MINWAKQRVVVTGAGGFLGSHVMEALRAAGCTQVVLVRRADYDLTREREAERLFAHHPADVVIHLAGLVGGIVANKRRPADFFYRNLMMGTLVMHYAWQAGAGKFVAAGAGCGYPEHAPMPLREESFWDGFPQRESAPYSLAKRMLHIQAIAYWEQHRFPAVITVPGNIYGPHDNFDLESAHVVPALVRKFVEAVERGADRVVVWGSGRPSRDFVYAGDVAQGILRAVERYETAELVNLSSGTETSIRELVELLADLTGFRAEIEWDTSRPDGQQRRVFDVSKARRDLGFVAPTSLREGLALTVDWYRKHRAIARTGEPA